MAERALLDTCVLYPPLKRGLLLGLADRGLFHPLWSAGVAAEWAHLSARRDPQAAAALPLLLARMQARWPEGPAPRGDPDLLDLPDRNDTHVLAAALAGNAALIVTDNLRDFPAARLRPHRIRAESPDALALALWLHSPGPVQESVDQVWPGLAGTDLRRALKKAGLPRLGKALTA